MDREVIVMMPLRTLLTRTETWERNRVFLMDIISVQYISAFNENNICNAFLFT